MYDPTVRKTISIKIYWPKSKRFKEVLEAIDFDETTKYIRWGEVIHKRSWWPPSSSYSEFKIVVCGEERLVNSIMILLAAIGDDI